MEIDGLMHTAQLWDALSLELNMEKKLGGVWGAVIGGVGGAAVCGLAGYVRKG